MMLQKYNPNRRVPALFNDSAFDGMFSTLLDRFFDHGWAEDDIVYGPRIQLHTHENEHLICADVPGYGNDDIKVEVSEDTIRIEGKLEGKDEKGTRAAAFYKEYTLPSDTDLENVSAKLEKGVLNVILPRKKKELKRIEVL